MKYIYIPLLISLILAFGACEKGTDNISVEDYIEQLKAGEFKGNDLPDFDASDIIYLLEYRNDTSLIKNFPVNLASSYYMAECRLGVYVLWTVESIRAVYIGSDYLVGRFPSLNPMLIYRDKDDSGIQGDPEILEIAARAYYDWWQEGFLIKRKMETDPLEDTPFSWN